VDLRRPPSRRGVRPRAPHPVPGDAPLRAAGARDARQVPRAVRAGARALTRTALVTGVGRPEGIGAAIARRLAEDGAEVFTQSSEGPPPEPYAGHLQADFADPEAPAGVFGAARAALGHVDILVANHAVSVDHSIDELTAESVDLALAVNVRATLLLIQAFAAGFEASEGGRVILLTSGQGRGPMVREVPYATSKAALSGITLTLSAALAPRGITLNTVNPGPTDTGWPDEEIREAVLQAMPRRRWGMPEDTARLIAWLASGESEWVTGQVIDSDGGFGYGGA
jgi:3-oxoacyl-[acyl-carrier protein] reductase